MITPAWPAAIRLVADGRVDLDALVTSRHPLDDVEAALTIGSQPGQMKAIVNPRYGGQTLVNVQGQASADALNQLMTTMRPVMEQSGENKDSLATEALKAAGIDPATIMPQTGAEKPVTRGITPKIDEKLPTPETPPDTPHDQVPVSQAPQLPTTSGEAVWGRMVGNGGGIEASGDAGAVSPKGAMGLAQLMPDTARSVAKDMGIKLPADMHAYFKTEEGQKVNLAIGKEYYKQQLETFHGDPIAAAVAYNAGSGVAKRWIASGKDDSVLPKETRDYIRKVSGPDVASNVYPKFSGNATEFLKPRMTHPDQLAGLQPYFQDRLASMFSDPQAPKGLGLFSGARSHELQQKLFDASDKSGHMVAVPGTSKHEKGEAGDISYNGKSLKDAPPEVIRWVHQNASKYGMYFPMSWENWHIQPIGTSGGKTHTGGSGGGAPEPIRPGFERGSNAPDIPDAQSPASLAAQGQIYVPPIPSPPTQRNGYTPPHSDVDSKDPQAVTDGVVQAYGIADPSVKALIQRMIEVQFPQGLDSKNPEHIRKLMDIVLKAQKMKK